MEGFQDKSNNPKNEQEVNDYLMHMHEDADRAKNPEERTKKMYEGEVDKDELAVAAQYKLRTGDKRTAKQIALDWRENPEQKVA